MQTYIKNTDYCIIRIIEDSGCYLWSLKIPDARLATCSKSIYLLPDLAFQSAKAMADRIDFKYARRDEELERIKKGLCEKARKENVNKVFVEPHPVAVNFWDFRYGDEQGMIYFNPLEGWRGLPKSRIMPILTDVLHKKL